MHDGLTPARFTLECASLIKQSEGILCETCSFLTLSSSCRIRTGSRVAKGANLASRPSHRKRGGDGRCRTCGSIDARGWANHAPRLSSERKAESPKHFNRTAAANRI